MMKVKKLIELLQREDENATVVISADGITYEEADHTDVDDGDVLIMGDYTKDRF